MFHEPAGILPTILGFGFWFRKEFCLPQRYIDTMEIISQCCGVQSNAEAAGWEEITQPNIRSI
jgi:hypothetical protein